MTFYNLSLNQKNRLAEHIRQLIKPASADSVLVLTEQDSPSLCQLIKLIQGDLLYIINDRYIYANVHGYAMVNKLTRYKYYKLLKYKGYPAACQDMDDDICCYGAGLICYQHEQDGESCKPCPKMGKCGLMDYVVQKFNYSN